MSATTYSLELRPNIPPALKRLEELAGNMAYAWDREIRGVFWRLDRHLWNACGNNPKLFMRRIPQYLLEQAAEDRDFLEDFNRALSSFDSYMAEGRRPDVEAHLNPAIDCVAYFCAEFGLHESFQIYSGGLGILAGDHCKAVSDLGVPFVAVGLLYRQGYFTQTIDAQGRQQATYNPADFDTLPVTLCHDASGRELRVTVEIAQEVVQARVWEARVGHVSLYLLDTDVTENSPASRAITHQLYGGDSDTRLQQELVLGVGGVRALRALGRKPTVFHMNEGHAAFLILERVREQVAQGMGFAAALELVAAGCVFTTHTPVAAGHDTFNDGQIRWFLQNLLPLLKADETEILALGRSDPKSDRFNMTSLALHGSRFHNGVSKIHGEVASRMEQSHWPQVAWQDNPISHVTNGVHMHTFIARAWTQLFHDSFREWRNRLLDTDYWSRIDSIPYDAFVAVRRKLKRDLLIDVAERLRRQLRRNGVPESIISRATRYVDDVNSRTLILGFARRFATYKRATLVLGNEARLARILSNSERPALLIFAGKAHPKDQPGQDLIRELYEASLRPEFIGRLIMLEGYDMLLARNLVQGCDVWLNNPEFPLEASGTSGMKAAINGVVNVSVLDGWWGEGYDGSNGFAVKPTDPHYFARGADSEDAVRRKRDEEECKQLLDLIEYQVAPTYYGPRNQTYAQEWVQISRNSMKTLIPRFNSARMVMDYVRGFYGPAARQYRLLAARGGALAMELAQWKAQVRKRWPGVRLEIVGSLPGTLRKGQTLPLRVAAYLNGLSSSDIVVECVLGRPGEGGQFLPVRTLALHPGEDNGAAVEFTLELEPLDGLQSFRVRMRPVHSGLSHPFEIGCVVWA